MPVFKPDRFATEEIPLWTNVAKTAGVKLD